MGGILRVAVLLLLVVLGLLALLWWFQRKLIYLPLDRDVPDVETLLPGGQPVRFPAADGLELAGWFLPAAGRPARGTFLVFPGNAGHRGHRAPLAARLSQAGYSVLLFDYRGYGENPGRPSEAGLLADARGALRWVRARPDVDPRRVVYFGESLGTGVAVALAAETPPAALVLRSPFPSLPDVGRVHYPFLPLGALMTDRFPSAERLARMDVPLLVVAGGADRIVPPELSRRLYEAAATTRKRWMLIEGAAHNDLALLAGDRLIEAVVEFVEAAGEKGTSPPGQ
jgi:fermentation-respiration switch protein FrsA (DUF1100 family)